jgi:hypothetical protein
MLLLGKNVMAGATYFYGLCISREKRSSERQHGFIQARVIRRVIHGCLQVYMYDCLYML